MIELPEAIVLSKEINESLSGKTIVKVEAAQSPHKLAWYHQGPENYPALLNGCFIDKSFSQGGFVTVELSNGRTILLSEGIRIRYFVNGDQLPKKHQLLLEFSDQTFLVCSVQMYGGLVAFKGQEYEEKYYKAGREKPMPTSSDFSVSYYEKLVSESSEKLSMKAFLATEQRIPGLGNGVLQDILFNANLHPKRKLATLNDSEHRILFQSIIKTLQEMVDGGGRDTEADIFGQAGSYHTKMCKNTVGKPCAECGDTIVKQAYMGGSVYFCPKCQPI